MGRLTWKLLMMARNSISLRKKEQALEVDQDCSVANESGARQRTAEQISRPLEMALEVAANVARDALVGTAESDRRGKHRHRSFQLATIRRSLRCGASRATERAAKAAFFRDVFVAEPLERRERRAQIFY